MSQNAISSGQSDYPLNAMKVKEIIEDNDGSATMILELTKEELRQLVEKAVITLLDEAIRDDIHRKDE